jgi:hypothetical protein
MTRKLIGLGLALGLVAIALTARAEQRRFSGAINGKYWIVMKLNIQGGSVGGTYYYEKYGKDIRLEGSIDGKGNISLTEFNPKDGSISGSFAGKFVSYRRIEGRWTKGDGSKTMPFWVEEE